jgi:hypothetical protein
MKIEIVISSYIQFVQYVGTLIVCTKTPFIGTPVTINLFKMSFL